MFLKGLAGKDALFIPRACVCADSADDLTSKAHGFAMPCLVKCSTDGTHYITDTDIHPGPFPRSTRETGPSIIQRFILPDAAYTRWIISALHNLSPSNVNHARACLALSYQGTFDCWPSPDDGGTHQLRHDK